MTDNVAVRQYLCQRTHPEEVTERGLSQETCRLGDILNVDDGHHRVLDPVIDYGVHGDSHRVSRQDLLNNILFTVLFLATLRIHDTTISIL